MRFLTTSTQHAADHGERATLSVADVITATGLSRNAVYDAIRRGDIPSVRVGRRVLVPRRAFDAWLDGARPSRAEEAV